jgi:hypothetical protein
MNKKEKACGLSPHAFLCTRNTAPEEESYVEFKTGTEE